MVNACTLTNVLVKGGIVDLFVLFQGHVLVKILMTQLFVRDQILVYVLDKITVNVKGMPMKEKIVQL